MSAEPRTTAQILPFCRPGQSGNELTMRDRIDTWAWEDDWHRSGFRVAICDAGPADWVELGSSINIYRTGQCWPDCTLTREAGVLRAWWCADGADIGRFPSMRSAFYQLFPLLCRTVSPQPDERAARAIILSGFAASSDPEWEDGEEAVFAERDVQTLSAG